MSHGSSNVAANSWEWQGTCNECAKKTQAPRDVFCDNFGSSRGSFPACLNTWCPGCYKDLTILRFPKQLPENDEGLVWRKKMDEERFDLARKGDTLFAPFQCDFCWFVNLKGRLCNSRQVEDRLCIAIIRRVNLDMFWSRETSTIHGMYRIYEQARRSSDVLGIRTSIHLQRKPWPLVDNVGFGDAMLLLWQSLQGGKTCADFQQFESIRKIRSLVTTMQQARGRETMDGVSFKDGTKSSTLFKTTSNSMLFSKFIKGCEKRMGRTIKQDAALALEVLVQIMRNLEKELEEVDDQHKRHRDIVMLGNFLLIGFCDALRGNEVFLVESSSLCKYNEQGRPHKRPHVLVPLMGRFKGETGERNVLRVLVEVTKSGLEVRKWIDRMVKLLKGEGRGHISSSPGPAFCNKDGSMLSYQYLNSLFHDELLYKVQEAHPELILPEVEVAEVYNLYRSLRRGATSRASALNYSETVINLNNRWRTTQSNKGKGGLKKMSQLYIDVCLVLDALLDFSTYL